MEDRDQNRAMPGCPLTGFTAFTDASQADATYSSEPLFKSNSHVYCSVPFCTSARWKSPDISFHRFPNAYTDAKRRELWVEKVRLGKPASSTMVICSRHFQPQDFFLPARNFVKVKLLEDTQGTCGRVYCSRRRLKRTAVPSQNLPDSIDAVASEKGRISRRQQHHSEEITEAEVHLIDEEHGAYGYTEKEEAQILACMSASPVVLLKRLKELPPETSRAALPHL